MIPDCNNEAEKSFVIQLAEEVEIETIILSNHEEFSANLEEI